MTLRIYNTLSRKKEDFQTIEPGKVGIYLCGPTVYKHSHIGHMVGPVIIDTIARYLKYNGYEVKFVNNITDIDDKLINKAAELNTTVEKLAAEMTQDYFDNLETMGVDTITDFPKATDYIQEMQNMIQSLVETGYAYPLDGDVYFSAEADKNYGCLSGRKIDEMMAGTRVEANDKKKNPADFALWKKSRQGEPAWDSPWGPGRPGWHIECSAMSQKLLGDSFDIHGGGLDLMFPHHENERAQSECCTGKSYVRYWVHNGLMQASDAPGKMGGQHDRSGDVVADQEAQEENKLAGSKGAASVKELFAIHPPEIVRLFLLSTHYRSPIAFSDENIQEAGKGLEGFYRFFETFERITDISFYDLSTSEKREDSVTLEGEPSEYFQQLSELRQRFLEAMDDDFNTGGAIGYLFELRSTLNAFIHSQKLDGEGKEDPTLVEALKTGACLLKELSNLLGVFRKPCKKEQAADDGLVNQLMELVLDIRKGARESKNWDIADKIRDGLAACKITVEDRPEGSLWRRG
ncbi:MAG: cysteine--tRNA ligase [Gimesia sp.]